MAAALLGDSAHRVGAGVVRDELGQGVESPGGGGRGGRLRLASVVGPQDGQPGAGR